MKRNLTFLLVLLAAFALVQTSFAQVLRMNEIYSRGVPADPDWIEIYNPTATSIDLTGYKYMTAADTAALSQKNHSRQELQYRVTVFM